MTTSQPQPGRLHPVSSLRSGRDWAGWLRQAHRVPAAGRSQRHGRQVPAGAWETLVHLARRQGFAVDRENCGEGEAVTTWRDRRIRVRPDAAPGQAVTALAHQLGHVLLHSDIARLQGGGIVPCQGTRKVEADSVAYLVATHLGIDAAAITFPHVSSWAGTDPRAHPAATIQTVSDRVLATASAITTHLDAELHAEREATAPTIAADPGAGPPARLEPVPYRELVHVHESAARFFRGRLPRSWVPGYLAGRGFGPAVQQHWQAGYAPAGWDSLTRHLRTLSYTDTVIEAAGLARRSRRGTLTDTFRDRAILPIRSHEGNIVAFIGRAPEHAAPGVPKYLNSPSTILYDKSDVLFGLWEARGAIASGARPVIVEGPFDAIAVSAACPGRYAGLAPCGTALTARHAAALNGAAGAHAADVLVAFDSDQAGHRAAVKAYHLLSPFADRAEAVIFPAGQDPAQILRGHGPAALAEMLANRSQPLADLVIDAEVAQWNRWLKHAEGQIHALRAAAPLIAAMPPDHVGRQVARLAYRLGLDYAIVTEAVTDAVTEVVADLASSSREPRAPAEEPQDPASASARSAGRDFPHTAQQAIAQAATAAPPPGQMGRAGAEPMRLDARRVLR